MNKNTGLIIIDVQYGFDDQKHWGGNRNNPEMEENIASLLNMWREMNWPIFHIKHNSTDPGSPLHPSKPGNRIKDQVRPAPGEITIGKHVNSAFIGTSLENELRIRNIDSVVIVGIQTDHCVSTTARMAANLGFRVAVVKDATATFDRVNMNGEKVEANIIHTVNLVSLKGEFAEIVATEDILTVSTNS